jgi:uncharacterized membrane protein HdeD (DUF308 family)
MLMLCGFMVAFAGGFTSAYLATAIIGSGLIVVGVMRLIRQFRAEKRYVLRHKEA